LRTATKVYVNLAEPERAKEVARLAPDGVGLLRAEFMIANIGMHPKEAIKLKKQDRFVDKLVKDLETFCKAFEGKPVVYRATDFKTNEYRSLPGGKYWEPEEPNPMLGFRGAARYIASPEVFNLELTAIKKVREKYKNLHLMIPFVRSPEELTKVRRLVASEDLFDQTSFKFWMMVEIPVNVIQIEDFIKVGIDGVSIGSNDLTMLLAGTDRDNSEVARAFNERSPAVMWALRRVIKHCARHGVTISICGQAPSQYEDLVEKLVKWGITSVSVNPDAIQRTREVIHKYEQNI
jgi:pyruvate,water dikinase